MSDPIVHEMLDDIFVAAGRDWVNPAARREKLVTPHEFDAFYVWRIGEVARTELIDTRSLNEERAVQAATKAGINADWSKFRAEEINVFLEAYSNRRLRAVALAEHCDYETKTSYWIIHVREFR